MDPITLSLFAVGAATSLFGASKAKKAEKQAMWKQQQATGLQNMQSDFNAQVSAKLSLQTQKQEAIRKQQLLLESTQAKRDIVRKAQMARAVATSRAANQGALNSSALSGSLSNLAGTQAEQLGRVTTDTMAGLKGFDINKRILQIQDNAAIQNTNFNKDIANLGGQIMEAQAKADYGKSLFSVGTNLMQNATGFSDTLKSLFPTGGTA